MTVWQKVFEDHSGHRAEIVRAVLEYKGLSPVIVDLKDSSYHFGKIEVRVTPENVLAAIIIIKNDIRFE